MPLSSEPRARYSLDAMVVMPLPVVNVVPRAAAECILSEKLWFFTSFWSLARTVSVWMSLASPMAPTFGMSTARQLSGTLSKMYLSRGTKICRSPQLPSRKIQLSTCDESRPRCTPRKAAR